MNEVLLSHGEASGERAGAGAAGQPPVRLRQAREAAGLHIAALAMALKVPVKKLEALEAGRYDELPDLTFARALASSACRHLKIDPTAVLDQIPSAQRPPLGGSERVASDVFKPGAAFGGSSLGLGWLKRPAVLLSALALAAAAAVAWLPAPADWPFIDVFSSAGDTGAGAAPAAPPSALPGSMLPSLESAGADESPVVTLDLPTASVSSAVTAAAAPVSGTADVGAGRLLELTARAESWIEVIDGSGRLQVQRVLKAGERLDFAVNPPYSVVLGRADAVQVQVRGQPFDVSPFARNSVARFEVK